MAEFYQSNDRTPTPNQCSSKHHDDYHTRNTPPPTNGQHAPQQDPSFLQKLTTPTAVGGLCFPVHLVLARRWVIQDITGKNNGSVPRFIVGNLTQGSGHRIIRHAQLRCWCPGNSTTTIPHHQCCTNAAAAACPRFRFLGDPWIYCF